MKNEITEMKNETNFEFGSPIKVDMMMHSSKDMSLTESGDKEGVLKLDWCLKKKN